MHDEEEDEGLGLGFAILIGLWIDLGLFIIVKHWHLVLP